MRIASPPCRPYGEPWVRSKQAALLYLSITCPRDLRRDEPLLNRWPFYVWGYMRVYEGILGYMRVYEGVTHFPVAKTFNTTNTYSDQRYASRKLSLTDCLRIASSVSSFFSGVRIYHGLVRSWYYVGCKWYGAGIPQLVSTVPLRTCTAVHVYIIRIIALSFSLLTTGYFTGVHSNQDHIWLVKIGDYIGFYVDRRSWLLWSPVNRFQGNGY